MTTTMLHVSASPRGAESESLALASAFLDGYRDAHPDHHIDTFDLWDGSLPEFGPAAARAKMAVFAGQSPTGDQAAAWQAALDTFTRFAAAEEYLFRFRQTVRATPRRRSSSSMGASTCRLLKIRP